MELIKSPLNYTGNKYRILDQLFLHFPKHIGCMVDMFCGGATVGINTPCDQIIFVDNNVRVINLLEFLSKQKFDYLVDALEQLTVDYKLSNSYRFGYKKYRLQCNNSADNNGLKDYNKDGYYTLRSAYNSLADKTTENANIMLYLLMLYAFNNDIRFNSNGEFNLPVGKTDLNKINMQKLNAYIKRVKEINAVFCCDTFDSDIVKNYILSSDFVYMDPPYLVGDAVYNASWSNAEEYRLLDFIDYLFAHNKNFALSNVMGKVGKINEPLSYWCYKNSKKIDIYPIDYNYRSSSYNKIIREAKEKEVVIVNKGVSE